MVSRARAMTQEIPVGLGVAAVRCRLFTTRAAMWTSPVASRIRPPIARNGELAVRPAAAGGTI